MKGRREPRPLRPALAHQPDRGSVPDGRPEAVAQTPRRSATLQGRFGCRGRRARRGRPAPAGRSRARTTSSTQARPRWRASARTGPSAGASTVDASTAGGRTRRLARGAKSGAKWIKWMVHRRRRPPRRAPRGRGGRRAVGSGPLLRPRRGSGSRAGRRAAPCRTLPAHWPAARRAHTPRPNAGAPPRRAAGARGGGMHAAAAAPRRGRAVPAPLGPPPDVGRHPPVRCRRGGRPHRRRVRPPPRPRRRRRRPAEAHARPAPPGARQV